MRLKEAFADYDRYFYETVRLAAIKKLLRIKNGKVRLVFMGTNTLLFDDGETKIFIDPYLSRHKRLLGPAYLYRKYKPKKFRIKSLLFKVGARNTDAIILTHTHPDHALDAPYIAELTGAKFIGSKSAMNIAKGWGLEDAVQIQDGLSLNIGDFKIGFIDSKHQPFPLLVRPLSGVNKEIVKPLEPGARAIEYKEGGSFAVYMEHNSKRILVFGSPGFEKNMLRDIETDILITPVGGLEMQSNNYMENFYNEVIKGSNAKQVFLSHWDNFQKRIRSRQSFIRNSQRPAEWIIEKGKMAGIDVKLLPMMEAIEL